MGIKYLVERKFNMEPEKKKEMDDFPPPKKSLFRRLISGSGGFQGVQRWTEERAGKTWNCHKWKCLVWMSHNFLGPFCCVCHRF